MDAINELFADIRNKLQPSKTALESLQSKTVPPTHLVSIALKELNQIEIALNNYEKSISKGKGTK